VRPVHLVSREPAAVPEVLVDPHQVAQPADLVEAQALVVAVAEAAVAAVAAQVEAAVVQGAVGGPDRAAEARRHNRCGAWREWRNNAPIGFASA
jgi:hypothetical protein